MVFHTYSAGFVWYRLCILSTASVVLPQPKKNLISNLVIMLLLLMRPWVSRFTFSTQIIDLLEGLLELSHNLPVLSPVGRFTTAASAERVSIPTCPNHLGPGGAQHSQQFALVHQTARQPDDINDSECEEVLQQHVVNLSSNDVEGRRGGRSGRRTRNTPIHDRTRTGRSKVGHGGVVPSSVRRGTAPMTTSRIMTVEAAGRHRASFSAVSGSMGIFSRGVDKEHAQREDRGSSTGDPALRTSAARTRLPQWTENAASCIATTATAAADDDERPPPRLQRRQPGSHGSSLPSISVLVGQNYDQTTLQGHQVFPEGMWASTDTAGAAAVAVRDENAHVWEGAVRRRYPAEEKRELAVASQEDFNVGFARLLQDTGTDMVDICDPGKRECDPLEEELLGELFSLVGSWVTWQRRDRRRRSWFGICWLSTAPTKPSSVRSSLQLGVMQFRCNGNSLGPVFNISRTL